MKYIFIDTNIYLDFYRVSSGDLNKLRILLNGVKGSDASQDFVLCVNTQNRDEYYRNKPNIIESTLKDFYFKKVDIPGLIVNQWPELSREFTDVQSNLDRLVKSLKDKIKQELYSGGTETDELIDSIMKNPDYIDEEIIKTAERRYKILGNPPGKNGSCGDAIHWEYLLRKVPSSDELVIISADNDWYSSSEGSRPNDFLLREWCQAKGSSDSLRMYRSIQAFLKAEMRIALDRENLKDDLLEQLKDSDSFDASRDILAKLMQYKGELSGYQKTKLIRYAVENDQIYNAQKYSPNTIGDRLWQIVLAGPIPSELDRQTMDRFSELFSS